MHGWYIIRNDLCALDYSTSEELFFWVSTQQRSLATSFSSQVEAEQVLLRLHPTDIASVIHFD